MSDGLFDELMTPFAMHHACAGDACAVCALPDDRLGRARNTDPVTSHLGGESVAYRSGSQKAKLLTVYYRVGGHGLTDDEAAVAAGLDRSGYWKRCSELRADGMIYALGITRRGPLHGESGMVCAITHKGIEAIA